MPKKSALRKENECCVGNCDCDCDCDCDCGCCGCDCDCDCDCDCNDEIITLPLIGDKAPKFVATTTKGHINFPKDYEGKWVILFSHPADFTPVCSTEFMTFASRQKEFKKQNCELVGLSVDSLHSHLAWLNTIEKKLSYKGMKNVHVDFPLIVDIDQNVSMRYGMIHPNSSTTSAVRAVFFIDPQSTIRTILYYPSSVGRNFDEIMRTLKALQYTDKEKCATPADWQPGEDVIVPPANNDKVMSRRVKNKEEGIVCQDWFFCFKKGK